MTRTFAVFTKELTDALRDRRSLASGLLYALWGPAVMALALVALAQGRDADTPLRVPVVNGDTAPSLTMFLEQRSAIVERAPEDPASGIRARTLAFAVVVDPDYAADFTAVRTATVSVLYDGSWAPSSRQAERARALLAEYARRTRDTRLVLRGISPETAVPIDVVDRDLSTAAGRAAGALATLPIFLLVAAFVGGMNVAADAAAGERERGSLEALLVHPVPRLAIAAGKAGAAAVVCALTVVLTLIVAQSALKHPRIQAIDLPVDLAAGDAATILALLLPLAVLIPALQVLMSLFARSFKEAQTQLSMLLFAPMVPGFLFAFGTVLPAPWMTVVPVLGQHLAVMRVLRGEATAWTTALALTAVTLALAGLLVTTTARLLDDERCISGQAR